LVRSLLWEVLDPLLVNESFGGTSMASSHPFFDDIRSRSSVDPPQTEKLTEIGELVNQPLKTSLKPHRTAPSSVREGLECPVCLNVMYPPIHQYSNGHTS